MSPGQLLFATGGFGAGGFGRAGAGFGETGASDATTGVGSGAGGFATGFGAGFEGAFGGSCVAALTGSELRLATAAFFSATAGFGDGSTLGRTTFATDLPVSVLEVVDFLPLLAAFLGLVSVGFGSSSGRWMTGPRR
ncbi:MAG: hypothetical protein AAFQ82_28145 [Myxococcota bacterium]